MGYGSQNPRGMIGSTDGGQFEPYGVDPSIAPGLPRPEGWRVGLPDGSAAWDKVGPLDTDWALVGGSVGTVTTVAAGDAGIVITNPGGPVVTISQVIAAEWTAANFRIYAVDFVNGLDTNAGFADAAGTSSAQYAAACVAAGAVAKKTFAGLAAIFPRVGNGRLVEVVIANGGVNTEQIYAGAIDTFLAGSVGWAPNCPWVRATGTNTTAGAVAFAGTVNEFDYAGGITVPGLNVPGYNPTGAATTISLPCTQVGGAAPAFPAEPAAPLGWRIRFDNATATVALRNQCRQIAQVATATLTPVTAFSAVPAAGDVFYVEQAGVACGAYRLGGVGQGNTGAFGTHVVGVRSTGAITFSDCHVRLVFTGTGASCVTGGLNTVNVGQVLIHPVLSTRTIGGGLKIEGPGSFTSQNSGGEMTVAGLVTTAGATLSKWGSLRLSPGTYFRSTVNVFEYIGAVGPASAGVVPQFGGLPATLARTRIGAGSLLIEGSQITVGGSTIEGAGASAAIILRGRNVVAFQTDACAGTTGNNDVGLDLTAARGSLIILGVTPTVTGALGDVRLAGGQIITWAQAAATGIVDSAGNRICGTAGVPAQGMDTKTGSILSSILAAAFSYIADERPLTLFAGFANELTPVRWPTSLRLMTRLRAILLDPNPSVAAVVVTLYKNNVATAMTVTMPGGSALGTKVVDLVHPILFLDGDDWSIRFDTAQAGGEGATLTILGVTVEWAT